MPIARPAATLEDAIHPKPALMAIFSPVSLGIVVDVVQYQHDRIGLSAINTLTAVSRNHFKADALTIAGIIIVLPTAILLMPPSKISSFILWWIRWRPPDFNRTWTAIPIRKLPISMAEWPLLHLFTTTAPVNSHPLPR